MAREGLGPPLQPALRAQMVGGAERYEFLKNMWVHEYLCAHANTETEAHARNMQSHTHKHAKHGYFERGLVYSYSNIASLPHEHVYDGRGLIY